MRNVLFEDHSFQRLLPLACSVPTYEIRCGLFNTRERVELVDPQGEGGLLCREILAPLHTSPGWTTTVVASTERTLWLNGRIAPQAELIETLHGLRGYDWVLADDHGLIAAALDADATALLLSSWQKWQAAAWQLDVWELPAAIASLPEPDLTGLSGGRDLGWIWGLVPATSAAISGDLALVGEDTLHSRHPFGLKTAGNAPWSAPGSLRRVAPEMLGEHVHIKGQAGLYIGSGGADLAPGTHLDTSDGPIVLDGGVKVMAHCFLSGPLYVGRGTTIKPGARIFGESSFGVGNRLAGEIGESTFGDFANKQHAGFIGHAVLGSWINLGAMSTCSDLKNNYGSVRVDLGRGEQDTGHRFVGLMMGDHAKTAIGSLFNTGTSVGFASNIFGGAMPPKYVPNFSWGGQSGAPVYDVTRAKDTAKVVTERRQCVWTDDHDRLFGFLHEISLG